MTPDEFHALPDMTHVMVLQWPPSGWRWRRALTPSSKQRNWVVVDSIAAGVVDWHKPVPLAAAATST